MRINLPAIIENYQTIILDCDGVIFDSNRFKNKAFAEVLLSNKFSRSQVATFIDYHKRNGGISRYAKFEFFQREIVKQPFNEVLHQSMLHEFADQCRVQYLSSSFTEGFVPLIQQLHQHRKHIFIASGSDEEELRYVFSQRNFHHYFNAIYGSPKPKEEIIKSILTDHPNCLFVGDSIIDLAIARTLAIDFLALKGYSDNPDELEKLAIECSYPILNRFSEIGFE